MYRVAFDPALPVVAAQPFSAAGQSFAAGDRVDWRALGIDERTLFEWWRACMVVHPVQEKVQGSGASPVQNPGPDAVVHRKRKRR